MANENQLLGALLASFDDENATTQASMTTDRVRELIKESQNVFKSPDTKHYTSAAFPFSSDSLRTSTPRLDLSQKAAAIGKALAKAGDDG